MSPVLEITATISMRALCPQAGPFWQYTQGNHSLPACFADGFERLAVGSVRLSIDISGAELTAIDDYRSAKHLPSRSEAVRQLLMTGMSSGPEAAKATGEQ